AATALIFFLLPTKESRPMDFRLFVPLTKVDVEKRLVYGTIAEEVPDKANEIMDYQSARPEFEAWSAEIAKASDGKSVGNLRAMHGHIAAGKLETIAFDDAGKRIECCGKVVDDAEWAKVLEGVYTGFSMGGQYVKRWKDADDPQLTRYTPRPSEVSLVDSPCIPTATFEVVKEDGTVELRKFRPAADIEKAGARHSQEDMARVQALHDTSVDLGALCSGAEADDEEEEPGDDAEKLVKGQTTMLAKILRSLLAKIESQSTRIAALEAQPAPGGPVVRGARTIAKSGETIGGESAIEAFRKHLDTLAPAERVLALLNFSLANPLPSAPSPRRP
ncbi:MAG TPA: hypothetical protein VF835_06340, partial [Rhizomicrobium sp.]